MNAKIVLGLGYGDEGKGLTTNHLCSHGKNSIVVRFSGGQQAGHTVVHDGIRHVHSNFGAGTLAGVPSYFSHHTTIYPVTIAREMKVLIEKGITPKLTIHPLAKLTTPFDVWVNRNDSENCDHGTCGLGIGKTMKRNESPFKLYAIDLLNPNVLVEKLNMIRMNYYNNSNIFCSKEFDAEMYDFIHAVHNIKWNIKDYRFLRGYKNIVFEGSQGILLDMDHGVFPNVTYSNTTSKNALDICSIIEPNEIDIYYVSRCYSTRHGSGKFSTRDIELINTENETNVYNKYQGSLKYGEIDYDLLNHAMRIDSIYSLGAPKHLVVTCFDQRPGFNFEFDRIDQVLYSKMVSNSPDSSLKLIN